MDKFFDPNKDELTSTLNITSLRPVPSEISPLERLSSVERGIINKLEPNSAMLIILAEIGRAHV